MVGDAKQSIYSFQGANLEHFEQIQHLIHNLLQQYDKQTQRVNLIHCYRSSQILIDFLRDALLFAKEKANVNIPIPIQLQSHRQFTPSKIESMPLIEKSKKKMLILQNMMLQKL